MGSIWKNTAAAAVLAAGFAGPALADGHVPGEFSANVGFTSDYVFRGITQSDEHAAIQGGFDWAHDSGVYLGVWGSNVDFNDGGDGGSMELDIYGGYGGDLPFISGVSYDLGLIYYYYPGADGSQNYDYVEGAIALGTEIGPAALGVSLNYSPEYFGESGTFFYPAASLGFGLPRGFGIDATIGYNDIDDEAAFGVPDYVDYSIGLTYSWAGFDLDLRYIDTDLSDTDCADGCDGRAVFTISRSF